MGDRVPQVFEDQHVGPGATVISGGGRGADIIAAASAQNAHFGTQWKRSCDCEVADHNGGYLRVRGLGQRWIAGQPPKAW